MALLGASRLVTRAGTRLGSLVALGLPLGAVALTVGVNLVTRDASPGAQAFAVLPVLYAAHELRPAGALVVAAAGAACQQVTAWTMLEPAWAFGDAVYGFAIIATVTAVMISARGARDRLRGELEQRALLDATTRASQRPVLDAAMEIALSDRRAPGTALIMVDLDRFKDVNDSHGHQAGDAALRHTAAVIRANTRPGDVLARVGGDELAVLMPRCTRDAARERAESMVGQLRREPLDVGGVRVALTLSAGVAHSHPDHGDVEALYAAADRALYQAKRDGRDRVAVA